MTSNPDPADDLLLSEDERTHALDALGKHYADGRLDTAEFYDRSGAAATARTFGALADVFAGLPGGAPLSRVDGQVVKVPFSDDHAVPGGDKVAASTAAAELSALRARGNTIESLDWIIVGITLISFLVLQVIVGWDYAWIVWPSLIVTLSIPRMILRFSDTDEKVYEDLKKSDAESRKQRLAEAAKRIRELEGGNGR
ncbi:DUF1707 SHOCT-like domain-containing protein [Nocardia cyriacigeorgica]|uniref:DUF1707 domain-containing protein n=1 Tax=Nocardia cyriacigeorgica (strain GUH-2) TaxID=1127134 RepID=H6R902_NOCCG|nr:DUF1707 domain-containing protein [Nocardia cyriacigeorgica]MBF6290061.1 DUF1707 domain-containing protein [Nocardia cyriacigeorgica]MBF6516956.1 DUF1707 domain-containing protein [Nocardia cyriacigeorgica]CCF62376.1 protein of unknown function; putative coiled-coil protein [Nocardia cyriacigeorgica GUH-2]